MKQIYQEITNILLACGYASRAVYESARGTYDTPLIFRDIEHHVGEFVNPFSIKHLVSFTQAIAIEDWFQKEESEYDQLWIDSGFNDNVEICESQHLWRINRMRWCIETKVGER